MLIICVISKENKMTQCNGTFADPVAVIDIKVSFLVDSDIVKINNIPAFCHWCVINILNLFHCSNDVWMQPAGILV